MLSLTLVVDLILSYLAYAVYTITLFSDETSVSIISRNALVVGYGKMGQIHTRNLIEMNYFLKIDVYDPYFPNNKGGAIHPDYLKIYKDLSTLNETYDYVILCSPTENRFEKIKQIIPYCANHLLIEKPLSFHYEEGKKIQGLISKTKIETRVGFVERFNPVIMALKVILEKKAAKKLLSASFKRLSPKINQSEVNKYGDIVADMMSHDLDLIKYLIIQGDFKIHETYELIKPKENNYAFYSLNLNEIECKFEVSRKNKERERIITLEFEDETLIINLINQTILRCTLKTKPTELYNAKSQEVKIGDLDQKEPIYVENSAIFIEKYKKIKNVGATLEQAVDNVKIINILQEQLS
jgi:predicted dehydrogenase